MKEVNLKIKENQKIRKSKTKKLLNGCSLKRGINLKPELIMISQFTFTSNFDVIIIFIFNLIFTLSMHRFIGTDPSPLNQ